MDTSADVSRLSNMAGSSQRSVAYRHSIICVLLTWCHMSLMYRDSPVSQMYLPRFPVKGSVLISYLQTFITFILPACNLFLPLRSWLAISPVGYFKSDTNRLLRRWEEFLSTSSLPVSAASVHPSSSSSSSSLWRCWKSVWSPRRYQAAVISECSSSGHFASNGQEQVNTSPGTSVHTAQQPSANNDRRNEEYTL